MTEEQKKQLRDIIEKQRIFVYEEVVALMGLPKPEVRKEINRMLNGIHLLSKNVLIVEGK